MGGKLKNMISDLEKAVKKIEGEKKARYAVNEPVQFQSDGRWHDFYVQSVEKSQETSVFYYDITSLKPFAVGSAHLPTIPGVAEGVLRKSRYSR